MNVPVELSTSLEGGPVTFGGLLRVPWNAKMTKLESKLELVDNPGLNRTKVNHFKISVKFFDLSHTIDFGEYNGKQMQQYVVECYAVLQATNVVTTEVEVLDRWPSNLGDNYQEYGEQYPVEVAARGINARGVIKSARKMRKPARSKPKPKVKARAKAKPKTKPKIKTRPKAKAKTKTKAKAPAPRRKRN